MGKIVLEGWNPGFNKIALNYLLRAQFGYSLASAKRLVDDILQNQRIELALPDAEMTDIKLALEAIGVRVT
ncbi:hypothetical protein [Massilia sp. CCM 8734]|uniref:hypothetical protein n=1 Tax=Massilia sp. CCM 8734 TaxID=2609283 RepID=UPI00141D7CFB|nr:hypothetical protein [Massilia sp. CCM 8734]NHZ94919.1 hypothetical protein [Massilia sp. CCM 8734]